MKEPMGRTGGQKRRGNSWQGGFAENVFVQNLMRKMIAASDTDGHIIGYARFIIFRAWIAASCFPVPESAIWRNAA